MKNKYGIYVYADGEIRIGRKCPSGALPVIVGLKQKVAMNLVIATCSLSRENNKSYFLPEVVQNKANGIIQAERKMEALLKKGKMDY